MKRAFHQFGGSGRFEDISTPISTAMALQDNWPMVLLLCAYGFFKEMKPSEPYLTQYLTGESEYKFNNLIINIQLPVFFACLLINCTSIFQATRI